MRTIVKSVLFATAIILSGPLFAWSSGKTDKEVCQTYDTVLVSLIRKYPEVKFTEFEGNRAKAYGDTLLSIVQDIPPKGGVKRILLGQLPTDTPGMMHIYVFGDCFHRSGQITPEFNKQVIRQMNEEQI